MPECKLQVNIICAKYIQTFASRSLREYRACRGPLNVNAGDLYQLRPGFGSLKGLRSSTCQKGERQNYGEARATSFGLRTGSKDPDGD